jgi:tRNA-specific 2-thiouridylase
MSGGVDSSVAAYLTQQVGFCCIGATMKLYVGQEDGQCCSLDDVEDARSVASRMGIPFYVFNFSQNFEEQVMKPFVHCYQNGLTPNPCIECNRHLKFDRFLRRAQELECDCIVTGHYAQIAQLENGRFCLRKAVDNGKDQTYFLYTMTQDQLSHTRFPLGALTKAEARQIAQAQGFVNARKRDSQDICFIPDGDYMAFLERYTGEKGIPGDFLDEYGQVVGQHRGAAGYTLGQRKGLGLAMGEPVYVCSKDMAVNTVTVGPNESLFRQELIAEDLNWMAFEDLNGPLRCKAKARSRMTEQPATVYPLTDGTVRVAFDEPQRAITPGQAVVFYDGDLVIGGGTIREVL